MQLWNLRQSADLAWLHKSVLAYFFILPFYLPIRFYFGLHVVLPYVFLCCFALLFFVGFFSEHRKYFLISNLLDGCFFLFLLYSLLLLLLFDAASLDSRIATAWTYFFPLLSYFFISRHFSSKHIEYFIITVGSAATIVACYYIAEIYSVNILLEGPFQWAIEYANYFAQQGGEISNAWTDLGGGVIYIRIPGFLGHNHATGFYLGMGIFANILLVFVSRSSLKYFFMLSFIVCLIALVLTMSRTSMLVTSVGVFLLLLAIYPFYKIVLMVVACLLGVVSFDFITNSGFIVQLFSAFFSAQAISETSDIVGGIFQFQDLLSQFTTYPSTFFTGVGFGATQLLPPVTTDDAFFLQLLSHYGVFGVSLLLLMLALAGYTCLVFRSQNSPDRAAVFCWFPAVVCITGCATMAHSSTLYKTQIFPVFWACLGMSSVFFNEIRKQNFRQK